MPWKVVKDDRCPASKPWGVVNTDTNDLGGRCHATKESARQQQSALYVNEPQAAAEVVTVPPLVTIPGVDLLATGDWPLASGPATFTTADLEAAIEASNCPNVGAPIIKLGHTDGRFTPTNGDGEPAIGRVTNMTLEAGGNKITGDLTGMPGWLGVISESAYPQRSIEGQWGFVCQIGHTHPFVITAVALLGVAPPGVGVLSGLEDVAALYGVAAAAGGTMPEPIRAAGVTVDDVRRAYYSSGVPMSRWITAIQLDPPQLIVADDADDKVYRIPYTTKGGVVAFKDPIEVEVEFVDVAAAASVLLPAGRVWASAEDSRGGVADWPVVDETGEDDEDDPMTEAAGNHGSHTGTHSHPHSAFGAQGGDATHDHEHTHQGDAVHNHAHASAAGPATEGAADMEISAEMAALVRGRLGLADDAEVTDEQIMAALQAAPETEPVEAGAGPPLKLPKGVMVVDAEAWKAMDKRAAAGEQALARMRRADRDTVITDAVKAGKFSVDQVEKYQALWDSNPEGTRAVIAGMAKGVVPTDDRGIPGGDDEDVDAEYEALFGTKKG